jgi:hypothetical protein
MVAASNGTVLVLLRALPALANAVTSAQVRKPETRVRVACAHRGTTDPPSYGPRRHHKDHHGPQLLPRGSTSGICLLHQLRAVGVPYTLELFRDRPCRSRRSQREAGFCK